MHARQIALHGPVPLNTHSPSWWLCTRTHVHRVHACMPNLLTNMQREVHTPVTLSGWCPAAACPAQTNILGPAVYRLTLENVYGSMDG